MGQGMGIVITFPSREAASRRAVCVEPAEKAIGQVIILPVIRIERYEEWPHGYFKPVRGEHGRKRKRRASRS